MEAFVVLANVVLDLKDSGKRKNSAQKWLTVLKYGQFWKSSKTPGVFNYGVFNYGRFKVWQLQHMPPRQVHQRLPLPPLALPLTIPLP